MIRGMVNLYSLSLIFKTNLYFLINHPIKEHFIFDSYIESKDDLFLDSIYSNSSINKNFLEELFTDTTKLIDKNIIISSNRSFFDLIKKYGNYKRLYTFAYKNISITSI